VSTKGNAARADAGPLRHRFHSASPRAAGAVSLQGQSDLHDEKVFKGKAPLRRCAPGRKLGQLLVGKAKPRADEPGEANQPARESRGVGHSLGQHVGQQPGGLLDRRSDESFDDPAGNLMHRWVARLQTQARRSRPAKRAVTLRGWTSSTAPSFARRNDPASPTRLPLA